MSYLEQSENTHRVFLAWHEKQDKQGPRGFLFQDTECNVMTPSHSEDQENGSIVEVLKDILLFLYSKLFRIWLVIDPSDKSV